MKNIKPRCWPSTGANRVRVSVYLPLAGSDVPSICFVVSVSAAGIAEDPDVPSDEPSVAGAGFPAAWSFFALSDRLLSVGFAVGMSVLPAVVVPGWSFIALAERLLSAGLAFGMSVIRVSLALV